MQLCEKYRPKTWSDFIGQPKVIKRVRALLSRGDFGMGSGDCFWISGPSGTGKTALAHLITAELGADNWWGCMEYDGKTISGSDKRNTVANIERWLWLCPPSGDWKVIIVNEGQAIRDGAVEMFLGLLERLPAHRLVIFTSTSNLGGTLFGDEYTSPMARRCKRFEFTNQGLCDLFATRAFEIATAENLNGKPKEQYQRLVKESKNNFGDVLQRIDALEMVE